ncbi:hypothetical protein [Methanobacterium oryzae]|uniref:hypothetical protein n=1 Tax=Methanobacterium oryzae TaxID=69540 RepID=UPI003D1A79A7
MTEDEGDKHSILHFSIILCFIVSISADIAVNPQLNDINTDSIVKLDIKDQSTLLTGNLLLNDDINTQNLKKAKNSIESRKLNININKNNLQMNSGALKGKDAHEEVVSASSTIIWKLNGTKTVYLTSDRIIDRETDRKFLERIKYNLEKSGINVIIDPRASYPNQVPRAIKNAPKDSAVIIINYNCAGTIKDLCEGISGPQTNGKTKKGYLYKYAKDLKGVVYVNVSPETILKNSSYLPRAYDDRFSPGSFQGLSNPAKYILDNGIALIDSPKADMPVMGNEKADAVTNQIMVLIKQ